MSSDSFELFPDSPLQKEEKINFHLEEIDFQFEQAEMISSWVIQVIEGYKNELVALNFIFCNDAYLHKINLEYLDHDTFTDIITFPYQRPPEIEGDIFISIDRVKENAHQLKIPFEMELHRVMIHGVLHLCGFGDKSPEAKKLMTEKEDEALKDLVIDL